MLTVSSALLTLVALALAVPVLPTSLPVEVRSAADIDDGILNIGLDLRHLIKQTLLSVGR